MPHLHLHFNRLAHPVGTQTQGSAGSPESHVYVTQFGLGMDSVRKSIQGGGKVFVQVSAGLPR